MQVFSSLCAFWSANAEMFSYAVYTIWTGIERYDGKYFKNISDGSLIELTDMERFNSEEPMSCLRKSSSLKNSNSLEN